jgi:hypothetical protein
MRLWAIKYYLIESANLTRPKLTAGLGVRNPPLEPFLFGVSRLTMLKKELIIASVNVVESEWVDLYKISCYRS